ncbi:MAG: ABC transporter substrate-binding protein [Peptococcaceae bacterium]|jgi:peptide/nickel transport system substrate-binding protein|nr:ABC transporter substrate-binding protein [Peptococcaceae bacterium]
MKLRKMKKALALALAILLALPLLASCASKGGAQTTEPPEITGNPPPATREPNSPNADDEAAAVKTEVTIGISPPSNFDPLVAAGHGTYVKLIYSSLVEFDSDVNIVPDLAESYSISDDALTYTFKLRPDAKFSDGEPVKPSDVAFTYNTMQTKATQIDITALDTVTLDNDNVVMKLKEPQSTFILSVAGIGIVPERSYGDDFQMNPIGSGPYKLVQYDVDQQMILEANEYYYGKEPKIKRAVFIKMSDDDTRLMAAKSGQVDITITSSALAEATTIDGYNLLVEKTVDNMGIVMPVIPANSATSVNGNPMGNDIGCDQNLRKAIAYALDRQQLVNEGLNGYGTPAYSENDGMPWWNPESVIDADVDYAIQLLEEAGWFDTDGDGIREKDGVKASVPLYYFAGDTARQAVSMSAAKQIKEKIGVELLVEGTNVTEELFVREPIILAWGSANPSTSYYLYHSSSVGKDDWYNPESFSNATIDQYLDAAHSARSLEESLELWKKAQWDGTTGTSMRGECPYIFLVNKDHLYFRRDGLNTGDQMIHAHGDAWPLVMNLRDWYWES